MTRESYYVLPTVKPGDSIPWSSLNDSSEIREYEIDRARDFQGFVTYAGVRFTPIPYCTFGDYDGSTTTERSNHRVMRAEFPWLVHVYGDYGSEMLGYLGEPENQNPALVEAIDKLENYPIADEDDESELTMERESEQWRDHGCLGFADFLCKPIGKGDSPLAVILDRPGATFDHPITYVETSEPEARKILTNAWFTVLGEHGSGETSRQEGGGGFAFVEEYWFRTMERALVKRRVYQDEIERARLDSRVTSLEAMGRDGREVLIDLYLELGLHAAADHARYAHYYRTSIDEVIEGLRGLADAWQVADEDDDEDSYPDGDSLGGSRSL